MEYTKGKWEAVKNAIGTYTIQTEDARIGEIDRHFNAYLVAAAPDMYEALKAIASCESVVAGDVVDISRKALAKAEGKWII